MLPAKVKENIRLKGSWIIEYMVPCDGEFDMTISVDGIAAQVHINFNLLATDYNHQLQ